MSSVPQYTEEELQKIKEERAARAADIERLRIVGIASGAKGAAAAIAGGFVVLVLGCSISFGGFVSTLLTGEIGIVIFGSVVAGIGAIAMAVGIFNLLKALGFVLSQWITQHNK